MFFLNNQQENIESNNKIVLESPNNQNQQDQQQKKQYSITSATEHQIACQKQTYEQILNPISEQEEISLGLFWFDKVQDYIQPEQDFQFNDHQVKNQQNIDQQNQILYSDQLIKNQEKEEKLVDIKCAEFKTTPRCCNVYDEFEEMLLCGICFIRYHQCVSLMPCLHKYCGGCISEWIVKSDECPACQMKIRSINKDHLINNMIEKLNKFSENSDQFKSINEKKETNNLIQQNEEVTLLCLKKKIKIKENQKLIQNRHMGYQQYNSLFDGFPDIYDDDLLYFNQNQRLKTPSNMKSYQKIQQQKSQLNRQMYQYQQLQQQQIPQYQPIQKHNIQYNFFQNDNFFDYSARNPIIENHIEIKNEIYESNNNSVQKNDPVLIKINDGDNQQQKLKTKHEQYEQLNSKFSKKISDIKKHREKIADNKIQIDKQINQEKNSSFKFQLSSSDKDSDNEDFDQQSNEDETVKDKKIKILNFSSKKIKKIQPHVFIQQGKKDPKTTPYIQFLKKQENSILEKLKIQVEIDNPFDLINLTTGQTENTRENKKIENQQTPFPQVKIEQFSIDPSRMNKDLSLKLNTHGPSYSSKKILNSEYQRIKIKNFMIDNSNSNDMIKQSPIKIKQEEFNSQQMLIQLEDNKFEENQIKQSNIIQNNNNNNNNQLQQQQLSQEQCYLCQNNDNNQKNKVFRFFSEFQEPLQIIEEIFNENKTEFIILKEYMEQNKIDLKYIWNNELKKLNLNNQILKPKARGRQPKPKYKNVQIFDFISSHEFEVRNDKNMCQNCFDNKVVPAIIYNFRLELRKNNQLQMPYCFKDLCRKGLNCDASKVNENHQANYDHIIAYDELQK